MLWNLRAQRDQVHAGAGSVDVAVPGRTAGCRFGQRQRPGNSSDFLPHVFDRFRQADPSTTRGAWGLGIGLSIAKHIVELHGGTIARGQPRAGQGATFTVQLPASRLAGVGPDLARVPGAAVHALAAAKPTVHRATR